MPTQNIALKLIKENYPYLSDEFGVKRIGIFGSIAKGIEKEESDIDIIVELKRPIGLKFIHLVEYLEKLFNEKVDVLTQDGVENIRIKEISEDIKRNTVYV